MTYSFPDTIGELTACSPDCKACHHKNYTVAQSLSQKQQFVEQKLSEFHNVISEIISPSLEERINYRNRVILRTEYTDKQGWQFGLMSRKQLVPIHHCPVHSKNVNETISVLIQHLPDNSILPTVFFSQNFSQVILVVKAKEIQFQDWLTVELKEKLENAGVEGLWLHLFPSAGKKVFSKSEWKLIWGKEFSTDENGLWYTCRTFRQPLTLLEKQTHEDVICFFSPSQTDTFIDLYCGRGVLLSKLSTMVERSLGVEMNPDSVSCAKLNSPASVILQGSCEQRIPQWTEFAYENRGKLILHINPPRTGIGKVLAQSLAKRLKPDKIAYQSCSAGSLAKDLKLIQDYGYIIEKIQPFDFFPHTIHVEILVFLTKKFIQH